MNVFLVDSSWFGMAHSKSPLHGNFKPLTDSREDEETSLTFRPHVDEHTSRTHLTICVERVDGLVAHMVPVVDIMYYLSS